MCGIGYRQARAKALTEEQTLLLAREIRGIFRVAGSVILSVRGIGAQRTAAPGEIASGSRDGFGGLVLLHPIGNRCQHVELVERCLAALAMRHAWNQEQTAPRKHFLRTAVCARHSLVVAKCIESREPRIA